MKLSVTLPRGRVPGGGSAALHTFELLGKTLRGQSTPVSPPKVRSAKSEKRSRDCWPQASPIAFSVQSSQVLWPQHMVSMRSSIVVRLLTTSSAAR